MYIHCYSDVNTVELVADAYDWETIGPVYNHMSFRHIYPSTFRRMHLQLFQLTIWISRIVLHGCSVVIKRAVGMTLLYKLHSRYHHFPCLEDQQNNLRYHAQTHMTGTPHGQWRRQGGGGFGPPFMPEAIGLVYCTVHLVYILPEDSADSDHPVYLRNPMYFWQALALDTPFL